MGQATADLPDPLATSASESTSTDDLLAQLAGEEIERLLAETETTPEPQPVQAQPAAVHRRSTDGPSTIPASINAPAAVISAAAPAMTHNDDLEAIFTQLDELDKGACVTPEKQAAIVTAKVPALAEEPSVAEALAAEMAEDEAQHARPSGGHAMSLDPHPTSEATQDGPSPSLLVTLLALVSSPLDAFPDHIRDLIGKAAILTMLNALCVLAYVIFFRR